MAAPACSDSPRSRNCLREAHASLEKIKPLVLVHEADTSKGGLSLEDVKSQCPPELSEYVFGADAPWPITWSNPNPNPNHHVVLLPVV